LAHARVLELAAARIDEPALRARWRVVRQDFLFDAAILDRREIVARRPGARGELLAEQIGLGSETLEANVAVAVIFIAQRVEVVLSDVYGQGSAPPVLDAVVFDIAPSLEAADLVGAG